MPTNNDFETLTDHSPIDPIDNNGSSMTPNDISFFVFSNDSKDLEGFSPYYSHNLDKELRHLVVSLDYLSVGIINVILRIMGIEPNIIGNNTNMSEDEIVLMNVLETLLQKDWYEQMPMFLFDLLTSNNGAFMALKGDDNISTRDPLEPIEVLPNVFMPSLGFRHLDTLRCVRTGDNEFPVRYTHSDGKQYLFHKSRIFFFSDMPSSDPQLNGVGLCSVHRVLTNANQLLHVDNLITEMVAHGFTTQLITAYPFTSDEIRTALKLAENGRNDSEKNKNVVAMGSKKIPPSLNSLQLKRLPEGFVKTDAVRNFMALFASSVTFNVREIWPLTGITGATMADAEVTERQTRRKLISWFTHRMQSVFNSCFMPIGLGKIDFGYIDEVEAKEGEEARKNFSQTIEREILNGTMTVEVAVMEYIDRGYYTQEQGQAILADLQRQRALQQSNILLPPLATQRRISQKQVSFGDITIDEQAVQTAFNNSSPELTKSLTQDIPQEDQYDESIKSVDLTEEAMIALLLLYYQGLLTKDQLDTDLNQLLLDEHIRQAGIANDSIANLTPELEGIIIGSLVIQKAFMNRLLNRIDDISEAEAKRLIGMYANSGRVVGERIKALRNNVPFLPFEPSQRCQCRTNCRCFWIHHTDLIDNQPVWVKSEYVLDPNAKHCDNCVSRRDFAGGANPWTVDRLGEPIPSSVYA